MQGSSDIHHDEGKHNRPVEDNIKNFDSRSSYGSVEHSPSVYKFHGHNPFDEDHCHRERADEGIDTHARRKLIIASILCLLFMIAEIIGGVLSKSLAIATDAAHLLTDFASFMISLFAISLAARPSTQRMSFGWHRAEIIGALVSVSMIWVITGILVWLAINRIITGEFEVDAKIMLITSALGILANLIMGFQLYQSGHGHSHGGLSHSHAVHVKEPENHVTVNVDSARGSKLSLSRSSLGLTNAKLTPTKPPPPPIIQTQKENLNVRAAFIHVVGDVLQSVGVFIAAIIIFFKPEWAIVDPICTFLFSIIVLFTTWGILKDALLVLMEATPNNLHYAEVMNTFQKIEGVQQVHNLRIWALSLNKIALAVHLAITPGYDAKKVLKAANTAVHLKYNFYETTIQIEDATPDMANCEQCVLPEE